MATRSKSDFSMHHRAVMRRFEGLRGWLVALTVGVALELLIQVLVLWALFS